MLQLRTTIDGAIKYIDLYGDEDVKYNYSFAEIQNYTSKNSNFSQSFSIPGSKNNNDIFNYYYDLNTTSLTYDVRRIFDASLLYEGREIFTGYIRLNNVTLVRSELIYNITFYTQIGTALANIGDKYMADLDYSELSHDYNLETVRGSLYDPSFSN